LRTEWRLHNRLETLKLVVTAIKSTHHFGSSWTRMGSFDSVLEAEVEIPPFLEDRDGEGESYV